MSSLPYVYSHIYFLLVKLYITTGSQGDKDSRTDPELNAGLG